VDEVVLVVSELATNAIKHGTRPVSLRVNLTDGELLVAVTDDNPSPARLCAAADDDECGRGLRLVADLAHAWGVSEGGRCTWARFRGPAGRP